MDISIIIASYNTRQMLLDCVNSVIEWTKGIDYEIIVVDNNSKDDSVSAVKKLNNPKIRLIENKENRGFAAANNQGSEIAKGKYLLYLNSDTLVSENIISQMVQWMDKNPKAGVASCSLKNTDGSVQGTGGYFPSLVRVFSWMTIQDLPGVDYLIKPFHPFRGKSFSKNAGFYKNKRELDWVTGAFLLTRKEIIKAVAGWDEKYFMYVEEVDLCYRIKQLGWKVWYLPQFSITHFGGASGTKELSVLSEFSGIKKFYQKFFPSWQYPVVRFFLKVGAWGRIILFGLLEGERGREPYEKAFREA